MENMYLYVRYSFSVRQSEQIDAWKSCIQIKYRISMRLSALNTAFPCVCKMPNTCNGIASSVQRVKIHICESTQPTEKDCCILSQSDTRHKLIFYGYLAKYVVISNPFLRLNRKVYRIKGPQRRNT